MLCHTVPSSPLPPGAKYGGCVSVVPNITSPHPTSTCEPNQTELREETKHATSSEALTAATITGCFVPMNVVANTATVLTATVTKACAVLRADSACTYAFCTLLSRR